jgi:hypothetical protein
VRVEKWTEIEELDIEVKLREGKVGGGSENGSTWPTGTGSTDDGYSFLEMLEEEEAQVERKKKVEKNKRKREEMIKLEIRQRGLKVGKG